MNDKNSIHWHKRGIRKQKCINKKDIVCVHNVLVATFV